MGVCRRPRARYTSGIDIRGLLDDVREIVSSVKLNIVSARVDFSKISKLNDKQSKCYQARKREQSSLSSIALSMVGWGQEKSNEDHILRQGRS